MSSNSSILKILNILASLLSSLIENHLRIPRSVSPGSGDLIWPCKRRRAIRVAIYVHRMATFFLRWLHFTISSLIIGKLPKISSSKACGSLRADVFLVIRLQNTYLEKYCLLNKKRHRAHGGVLCAGWIVLGYLTSSLLPLVIFFATNCLLFSADHAIIILPRWSRNQVKLWNYMMTSYGDADEGIAEIQFSLICAVLNKQKGEDVSKMTLCIQ